MAGSTTRNNTVSNSEGSWNVNWRRLTRTDRRSRCNPASCATAAPCPPRKRPVEKCSTLSAIGGPRRAKLLFFHLLVTWQATSRWMNLGAHSSLMFCIRAGAQRTSKAWRDTGWAANQSISLLYLGGHFTAVDADRGAAALLKHAAALDLHAVPSQDAAVRQLHIVDSTRPLAVACNQPQHTHQSR